MAAQALPFVTTPSPSTYPIHWYKMKINGQYIYASPGGEADIDVSSTSENSDKYYWCFVEFASGKIAVYNKAYNSYLNDGYYLYGSTSDQYIDLVEAGSGNSFYIYFMVSHTQKMYLDYDYDNGLYGVNTKLHAFTVEGEVIEDPELTDAPEIFVDPYTDYYVLRATGEGDVKLYVDGMRVGNPYTHGRPQYIYTAVTIKATAKGAGKQENSTTKTFILAPKGKREVEFGDVNFDGSINTGDVSEVYKAVLASVYDKICDLNNDGSVNTGDVSTLYKIILGN